MTRMLVIIGVCCGISVLAASMAWAHTRDRTAAGDQMHLNRQLRPVLVSRELPIAGARLQDGYRIRANRASRAVTHVARQRQDEASTTPSSMSATITITATVMPTMTLVVDAHDGELRRIVTNDPQRRMDRTVFVVRRDRIDGPLVPLTASTWHDARAALAEAHDGIGVIWSR